MRKEDCRKKVALPKFGIAAAFGKPDPASKVARSILKGDLGL